jgi:serine/threonine protein phosphatase PrpC
VGVLRQDTFVVLGSNGLWDVLSDKDAVITAASALKVNAPDFVSVSVWFVGWLLV